MSISEVSRRFGHTIIDLTTDGIRFMENFVSILFHGLANVS